MNEVIYQSSQSSDDHSGTSAVSVKSSGSSPWQTNKKVVITKEASEWKVGSSDAFQDDDDKTELVEEAIVQSRKAIFN